MTKAWLFLLAAILLEVSGTTCMKLAEGFTRPVPSVLIFVFYGLSLGALVLAIRHLEIGVAYAIWSGLGTALIAGIGFVFFKEAITPVKVACIGLIILGVLGLHLTSQG